MWEGRFFMISAPIFIFFNFFSKIFQIGALTKTDHNSTKTMSSGARLVSKWSRESQLPFCENPEIGGAVAEGPRAPQFVLGKVLGPRGPVALFPRTNFAAARAAQEDCVPTVQSFELSLKELPLRRFSSAWAWWPEKEAIWPPRVQGATLYATFLDFDLNQRKVRKVSLAGIRVGKMKKHQKRKFQNVANLSHFLSHVNLASLMRTKFLESGPSLTAAQSGPCVFFIIFFWLCFFFLTWQFSQSKKLCPTKNLILPLFTKRADNFTTFYQTCRGSWCELNLSL